MASPQNVTVDQVRLILTEVIDALESPDYASKLDEAKEAAGNEMLKMMQIVFPMFSSHNWFARWKLWMVRWHACTLKSEAITCLLCPSALRSTLLCELSKKDQKLKKIVEYYPLAQKDGREKDVMDGRVLD
ncbi:hypothetical protein HF086_005912 [Spodoptera exigua]|uniref:Uncharacterized protein n=1 Tax=Spodoptera exigua TaxID=7107 RepID=A0A922S8R4_SPOEX|nr:hypothetical protein HF086_005912 [Spodoptera exigua]